LPIFVLVFVNENHTALCAYFVQLFAYLASFMQRGVLFCTCLLNIHFSIMLLSLANEMHCGVSLLIESPFTWGDGAGLVLWVGDPRMLLWV